MLGFLYIYYNSLIIIIKKIFNNIFALLAIYAIFYCFCSIIITFQKNKILIEQRKLQSLQTKLDHINSKITIKHKDFIVSNKKTSKIRRNQYIEIKKTLQHND